MKHLDDIEARLKAATPGPWKAWDRGIGYEVHSQHDEPINDGHRETFTRQDATLIAHAPDDLTRTTNALRGVLGWHPSACEMSGDNCTDQDCPVRICAPCGEEYPCATVRAITEALQGEQ